MPQISKEIIKDVLATLDAYGCGAHHPDLLLLLDQQESEPVAELLLSRSGHGIVVEWHKTLQVGTKLYAHSVPFTHITADDVTDEMLAVYFDDDSMDWQNIPYPLVIAAKKSCAGIINAFIKHGSKEMSDIRGFLAANLQCWHRLTGTESDELVNLFDAKLAEVETLRKDVERYRWLRNGCGDTKIGVYQHPHDHFKKSWVHGAALDIAIDAAIKGEQA
jgi:hypothetical protein